MSGCKGLHCDGCGHRAGPAAAAGLVLLAGAVAFIAARRRAIDHAASACLHVAAEVLAVGALTASAAG